MRTLKAAFARVYRKTIGRRRLESLASREMRGISSILDVGCGRSSFLRNIPNTGAYRVGLDIYEPYIRDIKGSAAHDRYIMGDCRILPFKDNAFECVVSTEVLEHLKKKSALDMIKEMERVASKKIILSTPNGFLPTYAGPGDNPDEAHVSGWELEELAGLGFKVYGMNGARGMWSIKNGKAVHKFPIPLFSHIAVDISEYFVYNKPEQAFQFFIVKDL